MGLLKIFFIGIFLAFTLSAIPKIYKIVSNLDIGKTVIDHAPGPCEVVAGAVNGSEDMEILPGTDVALVSSGLLYEKMNNYPERQGRIYYFDFSKPKDGANTAVIKNFPRSLKEFNPHGLSVWTKYGKVSEECKDTDERCNGWAGSGECEINPTFMRVNCRLSCKACDDVEPKHYYLLVVNHNDKITTVERFEFDFQSKELLYLETIIDPDFSYINDISATGERSFYLTNYMKYVPGSFMAKIENWGSLRFATLCYYDGKKVIQEDSGFFLPNGVIQSPDRKHLYLNHAGDSEIRVYEILQNKTLVLVQRKPVDVHIDNLNVDQQTGDVWTGGPAVVWKMLKHVLVDPSNIAPSQVIRIRVENGLLTDDIKEAFMNSGKMISGSTVALYHNNALLIGSIGDTTVYCQVKYV